MELQYYPSKWGTQKPKKKKKVGREEPKSKNFQATPPKAGFMAELAPFPVTGAVMFEPLTSLTGDSLFIIA